MLKLAWFRYCLGANPSASCIVITIKGCAILIDCGIELSHVLAFGNAKHHPSSRTSASAALTQAIRPELRQLFTLLGAYIFINDTSLRFSLPKFNLFDVSRIDYAIISNHYNILALPYLTERYGFRGKIIATTPTVQIGKQLLYELVQFVEDANELWSAETENPAWQLPSVLSSLPPNYQAQLKGAFEWQKLYTRKDVDACISRIRECSFDESILLYDGVTATALSSGYSIGSANWKIQVHNYKIGFISHSSTVSSTMAAAFATQGSVKTQPYHAQSMEEDKLIDCDVMIMSPVAFASPQLKAGFDAYMAEFCNQIGYILRNGGSVLVPSYPCGQVLDLFPILHVYLLNIGLPRVPIYFVSPASEAILATANISAEWLHVDKQNRAFTPEEPFVHNELLSSGRLRRFNSIHDPLFASSLQTPCIVFAGHPSLRCGDIVHLVNVWKNDPRNAIIFTDPQFEPARCLMPYDPVAMQASFCPLDPRLNPHEVARLLRKWKPKKLLIPDVFSEYLLDVQKQIPIEVHTYKHLSVLKLPLNRKFEHAEMTFELASRIKPRSFGNAAFFPLLAKLNQRDGRYTLDVPFTDAQQQDLSSGRLWGQLVLERLLSKLTAAGIHDAVVVAADTGASSTTISIPSRQTTLIISPHETVITTDSDEQRKLFAQIVASLLISN